MGALSTLSNVLAEFRFSTSKDSTAGKISCNTATKEYRGKKIDPLFDEIWQPKSTVQKKEDRSTV